MKNNTRMLVCPDIISRIRSLEGRKREALLRLERAEKQKEEGSKYYKGTELSIDDVIFSIREGQLKSIDISIDFYKKDLERHTARSR